MGTFNGRGVNLVGATVVGGAIKAMTVKSAAAGSSITAGSIGTFAALGNSVADVAVAGAVSRAAVGGSLGGAWRVGSLQALSAGTIASASVTTTRGGASMGSVTASKVTGAQIRSAGNITSVVTGSMSGSQLFAGVTPDGLVTAADAAAGSGQIVSVRIGSGPKGNVFANSAIAAGKIKNAVLGNLVDAASNAPFYGIAADTIVTMTGFVGGRAFTVKQAETQAQLEQQLAQAKVSPKKLKIVVV
jgi:hypothetical protein